MSKKTESEKTGLDKIGLAKIEPDKTESDKTKLDKTESEIILQNVSFSYGSSYGSRCVMQGFSLYLPLSGVVALSGPSGCGKTTLLRLLAGLEEVAGGVIDRPDSQDVAILFQEDRLLPGLAAAGQIEVVLQNVQKNSEKKLVNKEREIKRWLAAVELSGEEQTLPEEMSGGMRRRLALARCLAYGQQKALILLDEPFAGVDAGRAGRIMAHIRELGVPVIYTAHDAESLALADSVVYLDGPPLMRIADRTLCARGPGHTTPVNNTK